MTEPANDQSQDKTFTQADIDSLTAKHQEEMNNLAGKLRAEFKEKEKAAKEAAEKAAKQANMSELESAQNIRNISKLQKAIDKLV